MSERDLFLGNKNKLRDRLKNISCNNRILQVEIKNDYYNISRRIDFDEDTDEDIKSKCIIENIETLHRNRFHTDFIINNVKQNNSRIIIEVCPYISSA